MKSVIRLEMILVATRPGLVRNWNKVPRMKHWRMGPTLQETTKSLFEVLVSEEDCSTHMMEKALPKLFPLI